MCHPLKSGRNKNWDRTEFFFLRALLTIVKLSFRGQQVKQEH